MPKQLKEVVIAIVIILAVAISLGCTVVYVEVEIQEVNNVEPEKPPSSSQKKEE